MSLLKRSGEGKDAIVSTIGGFNNIANTVNTTGGLNDTEDVSVQMIPGGEFAARTNVSSTTGEYKLTIKSTTLSDNAEYFCNVTGDNSTSTSSHIHLGVNGKRPRGQNIDAIVVKQTSCYLLYDI